MKTYRMPIYSFPMVTTLLLLALIALPNGAQAAPQYSVNCEDCHRMPPLDSANGSRDPASGAFKGNHETHAGSDVNSCVKCHGQAVTDYPTGHRTKQIRVSGSINGTGAYSKPFANQTTHPTVGTCATVNCHFERTTPAWGDSAPATCASCHDTAPADGSHPALAGSGKKHGDYYGTGSASCAKCHPNHATFAHATSAGKRALILEFGAPNSGGSYSKSENLSYPNYLPSRTAEAQRNGDCSNLYCHSDGAGHAPKKTATWGSTLPEDCTGCHGGNASTGADAIASGTHGKHITNAAFLGTNYQCARCHNDTVSTGNDQSVTTLAKHLDGTRTVAFNNGGSYTGGSCVSTMCHSAGKSAAPQPATPAWGGAALDCKGCHGANSGVNGTPSLYGEPSYQNGGAATALANSHNANHVSGADSCATCHADTTVDGVSIRPGSTVHTDGSINVKFSAPYDLGTASYNGALGEKSCANTYCHSNGNGGPAVRTAKWGDAPMPANCTGCHGGDAGTATPIASAAHRAHMNNISTLGAGNNMQCAVCHAKTVTANQAITTAANHLNRMKDYSGARAGSYNAASKSCSTYCHSSGERAPAFVNMTGSKSWNGGAKLSCNGCHGYGPGAFTPIAGESNFPNGGPGSGRENSHEAHTAFLGIKDSTGCATCHHMSADMMVKNKLRDYSSVHLNGKVDMHFKTIANYSGHYDPATKSCSNNYCHGGATTYWGGESKNCNACHTADSTLAGRHSTHWTDNSIYNYPYVVAGNGSDKNNYRFYCASCHLGTDSSGPSTQPGANGAAAEVFFGYTTSDRLGSYTFGQNTRVDGTLKWTDGTCANVYCHSNGHNGPPNNTNFNWNSPVGTLNCTGCHGNNAASATPIASDKHPQHINNTGLIGFNMSCTECHANTVDSDSHIANKGNHVNKFKDFSGAKAPKSRFAASSPAVANCTNNVYCHTNGGKVPQAVTDVYWLQSYSWDDSKCNHCHGLSNLPGSPDYTSGPAGSLTANSHVVHNPVYNIDCAECHNRTTKGGVIRPGIGAQYHLDRNLADVFYNQSTMSRNGTYNAGARSCANLYCHSDGTKTSGFTAMSTAQPVWGAKLGCKSCHGFDAAAGAKAIQTNVHGAHTYNAAAVGRNMGCQECHSSTTANGSSISVFANHVDEKVNVKFDNAVNRDLDQPSYNGQRTDLAAAGSVKAAGSATANCANVYCHSNGTINAGATPSFRTIAWNAAPIGCDGCHGAAGKSYPVYASGAAGSASANNHVKHIEAKGYSCDYCHVSTSPADSSSAVTNGGNHLNRVVNVDFRSFGGKTGDLYNGALNQKNCTNTYCHSSGEATPAPALKTAKWGDKLDCRGCHGGDTAHANPINTNKHAAHLNNAAVLGAGNSMQCAECHASTVSTFANNTTITDQLRHVNVLRDYSGARAGKIALANSGKCNTSYCHSNGAKTNRFVNMTGASWASTRTLDCNGCHGNEAGADFAPFAGAPNYVNAAGKENSHRKHLAAGTGLTSLADSRGCAVCHRTTVDAGVIDKLADTSSVHLNRVRDVAFATIANYSGHYSAASMSCANTYCHSSGTAVWGGASLTCDSCHKADKTLGGRHDSHWEQTVVSTSFATYSGNVSSAGQYRFTCNSCHNGSHANGPVTGGNAAEVFFNFTTPGKKGSYAYGSTVTTDGTLQWSNGTGCQSNYCHSDGRAVVGAPTVTSFTWASAGGGATLGCAGCHGGSAASFSPISSNRHKHHINPAATGNTALLPSGYACGECHAKTVATASDTALTNKRLHVNKFRDYSGQKAPRTGYTGLGANCSASYCHGNGKGTQNGNSVTWGQSATWSSKCNQCHGTTNALGYPDYATGAAGSATANSHAKHSAGTTGNFSYSCDKCHFKDVSDNTTVVAGGGHINKAIGVNLKKTFPAYSNYSGSYNQTVGQKGCSNTYCHGTQTSAAWGATALTCDSCHKASSLLTAGHSAHYDASVPALNSYTTAAANRSAGTTYKFSCSSCHPRVAANHVAGPVSSTQAAEVFFGFSTAGKRPAYSAGGAAVQDGQGFYYTPAGTSAGALAGTCNTTYCHSNGNGGAGNAGTGSVPSYTWATAKGTITCAGCHGGNAASLAPIASGAHQGHINNVSALYANAKLACAECHASVVSNDTTIASAAKHVNKFKDYSGLRAARTTYAGGNGTCTSYCHSNGKVGTSVGLYVNYTSWYKATTTQMSCNGCHGQERKASFSRYAYGTTYPSFPNYTTGGSGTAVANSHRSHVGDKGINCNVCHYTTTNDGSTLAAGGKHLNGQREVAFSGFSSSWKAGYAGGTCSTIFCHSNARGGYQSTGLTWGAGSNCSSCHPMNSLSKGHIFHVYTSAAAPAVYANLTGNHSTSGAQTRYNYGCAVCHPITPDASHGMGAVRIDLRNAVVSGQAVGTLRAKNSSSITAGNVVAGAANSGTIGTPGVSVKCANVYCHSNGYAADLRYVTTPDWYGGTFTGDRCANCHGNWPNAPKADSSVIVGSPTHYNTNWLGSGSAGGHAMGIHAAKIANSANFTGLLPASGSGNSSHGVSSQATTIGCNTCHSQTVTDASNFGSAQCSSCHTGAGRATAVIASKAMHINGAAEVQLQSGTFNSKAQLRDASFANISSSTLWHRNGGYKAGAASFDSSKQNLNVGSYVGGNCTTVCHMNKPVKWLNPGAVDCSSCHQSL